MIKTSKQALAQHFGMNLSELKEYEYAPGKFTSLIYAIGNEYFCCGKGEPAQPTDNSMTAFDWLVNGNYNGFKVWKYEVPDEVEKFDTQEKLTGVSLALFFLTNLKVNGTLGNPMCDKDERRRVICVMQNTGFLNEHGELKEVQHDVEQSI